MKKAHINLSFKDGIVHTEVSGKMHDVLLLLVNAYYSHDILLQTVKESIYLFENQDECLSTEEL